MSIESSVRTRITYLCSLAPGKGEMKKKFVNRMVRVMQGMNVGRKRIGENDLRQDRHVKRGGQRWLKTTKDRTGM